jgi:hypothetical protein
MATDISTCLSPLVVIGIVDYAIGECGIPSMDFCVPRSKEKKGTQQKKDGAADKVNPNQERETGD